MTDTVNLTPLLSDAERFLTALDSEATAWTFQTFDDKPTKDSNLIRQLHGTLEQHAAELTRLNNQGAGVFVTIQETDLTGRDKSHIQRVRACFADFDTVDPNTPARLQAFALAPSIIVESSPGKYHAYWLVDDLALDQFTDVQKRIIRYWKSDDKPHDLARVMRLPGFLHQKSGAFQTRVIDAPGTLYTAADLIGAFPAIPAPLERPQASSLPEADRYAQAALERAIGAVTCAHDGGRNDELNRQAFGLFGLVKAGRLNESAVYDALHRAGAAAGLAPGEIKATLKSAWNKAEPRYNGIPSEHARGIGTHDNRRLPQNEWPEPMPLAGISHEPEAYPLDALPDGLRAAVTDVQATTQAPLAMVATGALTALSLAGQAHINVARNKHLTGPVSLFALVLADSGERKSTVDGFFTRAIREYEAAQAEAMKPEVEAYQADLQAWAAKKAGLLEKIRSETKAGKPTDEVKNWLRDLEQAKPDAPKVPELIYGDATPEALTHGLAKKWPSGGVISSEAGTVFGSHGMGTDSVMRNLAALNVLWDGGTHKVSRRSVDSFTVRNARLTVSLQVQLPVLTGFMGKQGDLARGSGFLARFLVAWPESTQGTRQYQEPDDVMAALARYNARITQLLAEPVPFDETGNGVAPAMLELSTDAKGVWVQVYNLIEAQLAPMGSLADVKDVASKIADNAARIAALFHLYEYGPAGAISAQAMQSACKIAMWHLDESRRLLTELSQDPALSLAARLDAWLIERCNEQRTDRVSTRDVLQYFPTLQLRKAAQLTPVLKELTDADRARQVTDGRKKLIVVNPRLLHGGEAWA